MECQSGLFKRLLVLEISSHDTKVFFVDFLLIFLYILFDEQKACFAIFSSKVFLCLYQKLDQIPLSQITQTPLNPYTVVFSLKRKLLQPLLIKGPYLWYVFPGFVDLDFCGFDQIDFFEVFQ